MVLKKVARFSVLHIGIIHIGARMEHPLATSVKTGESWRHGKQLINSSLPLQPANNRLLGYSPGCPSLPRPLRGQDYVAIVPKMQEYR